MVDSRAKGARGEYLVRDMLREATGLKFERVPASDGEEGGYFTYSPTTYERTKLRGLE